MIIGINTIFEHDGRKFHLQAEDLGEEMGAFEVRVYDEGSVVWQKRLPHDDLDDQALRAKMEKTLLTVEAAIAKGKIG